MYSDNDNTSRLQLDTFKSGSNPLIGDEDPKHLIVENQLNALQRDYDNVLNNFNQLEVERDNAV